MKIWRTTTPGDHDYPIWAYSDPDTQDVVLLKTREEYPGEGTIWSHADIPVPPANMPSDRIEAKFQELADDSVSDYWSSSDWFRAGYEYAMGNNNIREFNTGWKS